MRWLCLVYRWVNKCLDDEQSLRFGYFVIVFHTVHFIGEQKKSGMTPTLSQMGTCASSIKKKKLTVLSTFHTSATLHPTADHAEVIQFLHLAVLKGITLKQTPTAGEKTSADLFHGCNRIWLCVGSVWDCMLHSVLYVFPRVWLTCMQCLFIVPGALPASTRECTPSHMQFASDVQAAVHPLTWELTEFCQHMM